MAEPSILGALRDPQFRSDTLRNLVEALNGAKRSLTVGSLGAVGDMGNTLANLVRAGAGTAYHETTGRPIPQALEYRDPARDFGTSASLGNFAERQGWLPPQTGSIPETAGALLGPIVAMKAPDLAQSTLRGLVSALKSEPSRRMVEGYMGGMGMKPQAIVYHGSPHQFDAFDSSKIGTGEGAQAYGHGLYLAEEPSVADEYARKLSSPIVQFSKSPADEWERAVSNEVQNTAMRAQFDARSMFARDAWGRLADPLKDRLYGNAFMRIPPMPPDELARALQLKDAANRLGAPRVTDSGSLYKVDLPDPLIARMLDWDKPLSQQAPEVQLALQRAADIRQKQTGGAFGSLNMRQLGKDAVPTLGEGRLRQAGIPGIRYLDGGSRADGAGTSNFVVFPGEESALTILERNGKPVRK